jgi:hypothetical protein
VLAVPLAAGYHFLLSGFSSFTTSKNVIKSCDVPVKEYYLELRITLKDKIENQVEKVS